MESRHILMFRGKIIGWTYILCIPAERCSVSSEVIEGTRLYLAVVLFLMVGLSLFPRKMSKGNEKKSKAV